MRRCTLALMMLASCLAAAGAPITTTSLIEEMADLVRLTRFPEPTYKTIQFSSSDRQSTTPGGTGWFANSDGFGGEPTPNFEAVLAPARDKTPGEYLMCDVKGPGAIVRLWTADISGTIQLFLDGAARPVYDGPAGEFFLHPYDAFLEGSGLTRKGLDGSLYQRNASYAPIPFAERCRIVWKGDPKEIHFYAIQVRSYVEGASVVSFSSGDVAASAAAIRRVAALLTETDTRWEYCSKEAPLEISAQIASHGAAEGARLQGSGALERLILKVTAPNLENALRQTVLHIQCDGFPWGQVQAPIGDFFGAGPGINPYTSLPFSVSADGSMICRYVMPYKTSLRIYFENHGDQAVSITGSALPMPYAWDDASMHFRARWRVNHGLIANGEEQPEMGPQDLAFLMARGRGVYVGTAVMLLNPNEVPTPWGNWWGEGDEKIFVDGDVRPSIFGTGSEDYFNYAWSSNDIFAFPFCGQPRNDGPANRGFVSNYRWHILDPLPFSQGLAFYMELFSHERTAGFSYARISYHYGREGLIDDHVALTDEDVRLPRLPDTWEPAARFGAEHCAFQACESLLQDSSSTSFEKGPLWQGGQLLVWKPAAPNEEKQLDFEIAQDGEYDFSLVCMLCPDGGSFRARIDEAPLAFDGKELSSLSSPHGTMSRMLGTHALPLKAGRHVIRLIASEAGKRIGLDFFATRKH